MLSNDSMYMHKKLELRPPDLFVLRFGKCDTASNNFSAKFNIFQSLGCSAYAWHCESECLVSCVALLPRTIYSYVMYVCRVQSQKCTHIAPAYPSYHLHNVHNVRKSILSSLKKRVSSLPAYMRLCALSWYVLNSSHRFSRCHSSKPGNGW